MMWYVYVLYSVTTGRTYTGITTDLVRRLEQHNAGKGAKATRVGRPWCIAHRERAESKGVALRREYAIKQLGRQRKLVLCGLSA